MSIDIGDICLLIFQHSFSTKVYSEEKIKEMLQREKNAFDRNENNRKIGVIYHASLQNLTWSKREKRE